MRITEKKELATPPPNKRSERTRDEPASFLSWVGEALKRKRSADARSPKFLNLMAGLNHDFFLLSCQEHGYTDYLRLINKPQAVQVHDDIMSYIRDTLSWITCYNPAKKMAKHKGLNFYAQRSSSQTELSLLAIFSQRGQSCYLTGPKGYGMEFAKFIGMESSAEPMLLDR